MKRLLLLIYLFTYLGSGAMAQSVSTLKAVPQSTQQKFFIDLKEKGVTERMSNSENFLKKELNMTASDALVKLRVESDAVGFTHERYKHYYQGVKVEHDVLMAHGKNGELEKISGSYHIIANLNTKPSISEGSALQNALNFVGAKKYMWQDAEQEKFAKKVMPTGTFFPKGELVIVKNFYASSESDQVPTLAYKFNVYASAPVSRADIYVDAHTGKIIFRNVTIKHVNANGTAQTTYSGSKNIVTDSFNGSFRLRRTIGQNSGIETYNMKNGEDYNAAVDFTDNDNNWTKAEKGVDQIALDAHWGAEKVYEYWSTVHARKSYDDNDAKILSYVHLGVNYGNAYWDGIGMNYGDGDNFLKPTAALDVCAHEIGHAVMENTGELIYEGEQGALNEGFSDIWGATIEYYAAPEKQTWLIGEEIVKQGAALRSMSNPNAGDPKQPDTYGGTYWQNPKCGVPDFEKNDYCGVHYNSGVLNFWFYLLSIGGAGANDVGFNYNVQGITIEKAAKIAYRTQKEYLMSTSDFSDTRMASIQAAKDLYGANSNEAVQVANAWNAVNVGEPYNGPCAVPTGLKAIDVTATTFTLTWNEVPFAKSYTVSLEENGQWYEFSSASNQIPLEQAVPNYNYQWKVKADCGQQESVYSPISNFKTLSDKPLVYCAPKTTNSTNWIEKILFSKPTNQGLSKIFENKSGKGNASGYSDFTADNKKLITLERTQFYIFEVYGGYTGANDMVYYKAWVDYNNDGKFDGSKEEVLNTKAPYYLSESIMFGFFSTQPVGEYRLRVAMKKGSSPSYCDVKGNGEFEDYTLNLIEKKPVYSYVEVPSLNLYISPNPTSDRTSVVVDFGNASKAILKIADMKNNVIFTKNLVRGRTQDAVEEINMTTWAPGIYFVSVITDDGQSKVSRLIMQ